MRFWKKSLMARLVSYFLLLSLLIVSLVGYIAFVRAREALTLSLFERLSVTANLKEEELNRWVSDQREQLLLISRLPEVRTQAAILASQPEESADYQAAYTALASYLSAMTSSNSDLQEVFILAPVGGKILISTDQAHEGEYRVNDQYFTEGRAATFTQKLYPSPVTNRPTITIATPLFDPAGRAVGVLATHLNLDRLDKIILERTGLGVSGESYLVDQFNNFVSASRFGREEFLRGVHTHGIDTAIHRKDGSGLYLNYESVPVVGVYRWVEELDVALLAEMSQEESFAPAEQLASALFVIGLVSAMVLAAGVYLLARQIAQPIHDLAMTAQEISIGELSRRVKVNREDEIGVLATAFNSMTAQLQEFINTLEQRVAERTEELERRSVQLQVAAEVARDATATHELDDLLNRAVSLIRSRFGFYHAGIFLVDEKREYAVLRAATGEAGREMLARGHRLKIGETGIVGYVTQSGLPRIVLDVGSDAAHVKNPYLPHTHSEMALPLKVGDEVIGALDVQSEEQSAFDEQDIEVLQTMADQLAVAIQNVRSYEQLLELDELKMQFMANMSHELRTPLNSIIGFSRLLIKGIDGPINDQQHRDITTIYNAGHHLLGLINNILDISKIEAGKMELDIEEVNLTALVDSVLSTASGLVKDKTVRLVKALPERLPTVRADLVRVRQILLNLLSNAIKFTDEGEVRLSVSLDHNMMQITVSDTGPGIPPDKLQQLFQAFYQVDGSSTRKAGGTGLGLAISKSFVEMHGGRIWVESTGMPGEGAAFHFTLPLAGPAGPKEEEVESPLVLAVDDEPGITGLYARYLLAEGYRFAACHDPRKAPDEALRLAPSLILLDVQMREMSGFDVMKALRRNPTTRDIPVLLCSLESTQQIEGQVRENGALGCLQKPLKRDDLLSALRQWTTLEVSIGATQR
ncbi:MAG: GAF domain-containing protein [Ardenticatenales bacterium]|nr:GAF domain-containing protein [Ardenticatenales bacterium]